MSSRSWPITSDESEIGPRERVGRAERDGSTRKEEVSSTTMGSDGIIGVGVGVVRGEATRSEAIVDGLVEVTSGDATISMAFASFGNGAGR